MNNGEIIINEHGVTIFGFSVGFTPTIRDFELACQGVSLRTYRAVNPRREQKIYDDKGISWLVDFDIDAVLWLSIRLAPISHRKTSEADPAQLFEEKVRIGRYAIKGHFSHETGEIVRKVEIPGIEVCLIPDKNGVRAITVAFPENERRLTRLNSTRQP